MFADYLEGIADHDLERVLLRTSLPLIEPFPELRLSYLLVPNISVSQSALFVPYVSFFWGYHCIARASTLLLRPPVRFWNLTYLLDSITPEPILQDIVRHLLCEEAKFLSNCLDSIVHRP